MVKMVQIHSTTTINVTTGLQHKDVTNPDAHVADRLKVSAEWPRHTVLIREGQHLYPAEIKDWNTVKALANDKIITIGSVIDLDENKLNDAEKMMLNTVSEASKEFGLLSGDENKVVEKKTKLRMLNEIINDEA